MRKCGSRGLRRIALSASSRARSGPAQKVVCNAEGIVGIDKTGVESEAAFPLDDRLLGAALRNEDIGLGEVSEVVIRVDGKRPRDEFVRTPDVGLRVAALRFDDRKNVPKGHAG